MKNIMFSLLVLLAVGLMGSCAPEAVIGADNGGARAANYTQCWRNESGGGSITCSRNGETYTANWSNVGNIVAG
ncbi:MAG: hypothetical protein JXD23_09650, partial [Spirochaetales bacterium]|nr:hypothetical protein [Spirochaetales bacterium]